MSTSATLTEPLTFPETSRLEPPSPGGALAISAGTAVAALRQGSRSAPAVGSAPGIRTIWRESRSVAEAEFNAKIWQRLKFFVTAVVHRRDIAPLLAAPEESSLAVLLDARPEMLAIVMWPYISSSWSVAQRVAQLVGHCQVLDRLGPPLRRDPDVAVEILDLSHVHEGVTLVLDQARWFKREGQLVLNLFVDEERMFSLAFDLRQGPLGIEAVIGGLQGRNLPHAQDCYRVLTKSFFGLRPRDLLFELFRALCRVLEVRTIFAVSDECRHHRSAYFQTMEPVKLSLDYDVVWTERGGTLSEPGFFRIGVDLPQRDDVPARKRAVYRRRNEFLRTSEDALRRAVNRAWEH